MYLLSGATEFGSGQAGDKEGLTQPRTTEMPLSPNLEDPWMCQVGAFPIFIPFNPAGLLPSPAKEHSRVGFWGPGKAVILGTG